MIRGQLFSEVIRDSAHQKSELQAQSQGSRPKIREDLQNPNRIAQKTYLSGFFGGSTENHPFSLLESTYRVSFDSNTGRVKGNDCDGRILLRNHAHGNDFGTGFTSWTVSHATLADATLVFSIFLRFYFRWWVRLRKGNPLSLRRHLFLHGNRVKIQTQGFLDLFFDAVPHLEYFFPFFECSTKAASPKAAFDTLQTSRADQGCVNHEVHIVNWNTGICEVESA